MSASHHFQKVHSDAFKAQVVEFCLNHDELSIAAVARMIREGTFPNMPADAPSPYYVRDETVREWVNEAVKRRDPEREDYSKMQLLAKDVFELCEREIVEIKSAANPPRGTERVAPDPARLQRLLETSQKAWKVIESAAPDPEPGKGDEGAPAPEPALDPEKAKVMEAFNG